MSRGSAAPVGASLALCAWLGAAVFFSAVMAPAAFRTLPAPSLAGALVGATLPVIFYAGIVVGLVALWLGASGAAGPARVARNVCSTGIAVCCALGQFVAVERIDRLRARLTTPIESLAPTDPARLAFDRLHAVSVGLLGVAMVLTAVSIVLLWRSGLASAVSPE